MTATSAQLTLYGPEVKLVCRRIQGEADPLQETGIAQEVAVAPSGRYPEGGVHFEGLPLFGQEPHCPPDKPPAEKPMADTPRQGVQVCSAARSEERAVSVP